MRIFVKRENWEDGIWMRLPATKEERVRIFGEKVREFSHAVEEECGQEVPSAQLTQGM